MRSLPPYKISSWLSSELDRLEGGNESEKQRYRNIETAIAKVLSDPLNVIFKKNLPLNYKAVDVLQQYADATLCLNKMSTGEYGIQSISVSHENEGLATRLLTSLSRDAEQGRVVLVHELFIHSEHAIKSRHLLEKFHFKVIDCIDDVEIWRRMPRLI